jgi:hypothetical protein
MKNIYIILLAAIGFTSCQKDVDVVIPYEGTKLVLNSLFRSDSIIYAQVSLSQRLANTFNATTPSGASVQLFENGVSQGNMSTINVYGRTYFVSTIKAKPNFVYTMVANANGYTSVTGTDTVPSKPVIQVTSVTRSTSTGSGNNNDKVRVQLQDDPNIENFYLVKVYQADTNRTAVGPRYQVDNSFPLYFSIDGISNGDPGGVFGPPGDNEQYIDDATFNGRNVTLNLNVESNFGNTYAVVEVISLTKSTYRYLKSVNQQGNAQGDPFAEATVVYNNIKNGYGIVGAANGTLAGRKL